MTPTAAFLHARDFLLQHREDYAAAYAGFRWPQLETFNWALDFFDGQARDNQRLAEFSELPKTISGKIRRVELRALEAARRSENERGPREFWEEDFPELR